MNDYFGYARVSTNKQGEGVSLEAQKEAIEAYAASNGLTISDWFEEKETAAKQGRPVFNAMVKALRQKRMRGLIVHKIDRSARNYKDWGRIGELSDEGFDIRFATESLDFQTRGGRLSADIQLVIAADYIRNLREEVRKGIDGRLNQGLFPFNAPIGYVNNGGGRPKTPDPKREHLVKEMFDLYATGRYSIRSLQMEMARRGLTNSKGKSPGKPLIENALSNPFYCGVIRIGTTGETFQGIHEPLIDVATFELVQDIKSGRYGQKSTRRDHIFRGLFRCGHCKYAMIAERQKGRVYYRCHSKGCPTKSIREDRIEAAVLHALMSLHLTEPARERLVAIVTDWIDERVKDANAKLSNNTELDDVEKKLERLTDALIDHLIDKDTYARRREDLLLRKAAQEKMQAKNTNLLSATMHVRKFLELAKNLTGLYLSLKPAERRRFLQSATSNRLVMGKNLTLEPSDWLQVVSDSHAVLCGGHTRPKTRTRHESGDKIIVRLIEAATSDNAALLRDMIDHSAASLDEIGNGNPPEPNNR